MTTRKPWLEQVPELHRDLVWIDENAADMFDFITGAIKSRQDADLAIDTLLLIFPQLTNRADFKRWVKVARDANRLLNVWRRENGEPTDVIGEIYVFKPQGKRNIPPKGKRRPRVRTDGSDVYELYLNLLLHKVYQQTDWLTEERINEALKFARRVNDAYLYHKTYQMLAFVCNGHHLFERALDYSYLALPYFEAQDLDDSANVIEVALTYFAMSVSHMCLRNVSQAADLGEKAADLFAKVDYPRQYTITTSHKGKLFITQGEFETALQWLEQALQDAKEQNIVHHIGDIYQHMGMAQGFLNNFDAAFENLDKANEIWLNLENENQRLSTQYMIAYTEAKMGNTQDAIARLNQMRDEVSPPPEEGWQKLRYEQAEKLIDLINQGTDFEEMEKKTFNLAD